uniref:Uncharacterized protein n=1 Tax=Timspurckia oligopyrenoides TaxID=708627 RepID=A0A7S1ERU7_9RHOD|mmetsp:Transcript_3059/g.5399  ORF Transcript_3059/g.5399 Transcript_3059/m.5399 type:complete len:257 (+) Transcript_3059:16-786(+)
MDERVAEESSASVGIDGCDESENLNKLQHEDDSEMYVVSDWSNELRECSRYGEYDEVVEALENGADVNSADEYTGNTALHYACANGHMAIVKLLVSRTASVEAVNTSKNTPFHWAVQNGHASIVKWMLKETNAPIAVENERGNTPFDDAQNSGNSKIKNMLMDFAEENPKQPPPEDDEDEDENVASGDMTDDGSAEAVREMKTENPGFANANIEDRRALEPDHIDAMDTSESLQEIHATARKLKDTILSDKEQDLR